ncbi:MAG: TetR/AcrR family transcriptional regulator [Planctomycetota bacterium]|jgi:AcrR family transcriptional regulator
MSAEDTKQALIQAAIRLLGDRSVSSLSVREIAREAGVNHGLVHRYFGSKDGLIRAAVRHANQRFRLGDSQGLTMHALQQLIAQPQIARLVARCCLDGPQDVLAEAAPSEDQLEEMLAPIEGTLATLGLAGLVDPPVLNAICVSAMLGWFTFRPLLDRGYGLPEDADEQFGRLATLIDTVFRPADGGEAK